MPQFKKSATLYWATVNPLLTSALKQFMLAKVFEPFRLVGGTALSLMLGHRMSIDIDLFTDAPYESIDFASIDAYLSNNFPYVATSGHKLIGMGTSYFLGTSEEDAIKLDLYYTEPFIRPIFEVDGIRMADVEDIIAMKVDIISRGGRKKDFWDLHELADRYSIEKMIGFHQERYPFGHNEKQIKLQFRNFEQAEDDFEPVCLRGKHWELIKLDFWDTLKLR